MRSGSSYVASLSSWASKACMYIHTQGEQGLYSPTLSLSLSLSLSFSLSLSLSLSLYLSLSISRSLSNAHTHTRGLFAACVGGGNGA